MSIVEQTEAPRVRRVVDASPVSSTTTSSWLAVLSVAVGSFALVTTEFLPVGLLPSIAASLHVSEGTAGLMVTIPGLLGTLAAPLITVGSGRLDRRFVLWALMALLAASNLIVAVAPAFGEVLVGRVLLGIAVGGFWTVGGAIGPRLVAASAATRATSIIFAGISLGTVAGVPAGALAGHLVGWRAVFGTTGVATIVVLLAQVLVLPRVLPTRAIRLRELPALFAVPRARVGLVATGLVFVGQFAAYTYITPFLVQVSGMAAPDVTLLLLAYGITGFVGNIIGGWGASRDVRVAVALMALVLGGSVLALPLAAGNQLVAALLIGVWGLAFGAMPITTQMWMFQAAPEALEGSSALFVSTAQIALASGALVGGIAVDHLGIPSAMVVGGIFALATMATVWIFGSERTRSRVR
ncbi:MAG TPA: MFS transporter [Candidatus Acidoferrum sp.]|nr:MFS transporter [Candidatus Acidoferrum sp.]